MRSLQAIQSYYRTGVAFPELELLRQFVFHPIKFTFDGELPSKWAAIYGPALGSDIAFPKIGRAVAIEDRVSCVILWLLDEPERGIGASFGFLHAHLGNPDNYLIIEPKPREIGQGDKEVSLREKIGSRLSIDFGVIRDLHFDPGRGVAGYEAILKLIGIYIVDIVTGETIDCTRDSTTVNEMLKADSEFERLPIDPEFCFEQSYCRGVIRAVVHGMHQYALLTRNINAQSG